MIRRWLRERRERRYRDDLAELEFADIAEHALYDSYDWRTRFTINGIESFLQRLRGVEAVTVIESGYGPGIVYILVRVSLWTYVFNHGRVARQVEMFLDESRPAGVCTEAQIYWRKARRVALSEGSL